MNDDDFEIRKSKDNKYYIFNITTNSCVSKNMENKRDIYKNLESLRYPPLSTAIITKKITKMF